MTRISRASLIIAFFFGVDKILGLLRQILFNRQFGPVERDIFFVSNNIPDLLSALISGGALGIALIPVLTEHLQEKGRQDAWMLFARILNLAFLVTAAISLVIIALADPLIRYVIAPRLRRSSEMGADRQPDATGPVCHPDFLDQRAGDGRAAG